MIETLVLIEKREFITCEISSAHIQKKKKDFGKEENVCFQVENRDAMPSKNPLYLMVELQKSRGGEMTVHRSIKEEMRWQLHF